MKKYDVVIIGSGLGGLICGYILGKNGFKVSILEKHTQPGGCLQTFVRKGITFDTGMHYVGSMEKGQLLYNIFSYLNLLKDVKLHKLDTDGFEHISLNGREYRFAMGYENFVEKLSENFPNEREALIKYTSDLQKYATSSPIFNREKLASSEFYSHEAVKTGIGEYLDSLTKNKELQNVLSSTNMLYAGKREKTPLYIHALINNFYIQSAWRIVGGANSIANSLCKSIQGFGGEIFTGAEVKSINCNTSRATSVTLANGEIIESKYFISNTHPAVTLDMLETSLIKKIYRERIHNVENTVSNFVLYIEFKPDTVPYINYNYYKYNTGNVWDCFSYTPENWPRNYIFMHQVPLKNPAYAESGVLISYMKFDEVKKWEDTFIGRRGNDYKLFKEARKEILLQQLENDFPGIRNNIKEVYTSSPLTLRDYTGTKEGSMYGILKDKNCPEQTLISHHTKVPNLFFTGQNINSHGILGVAVSAVITSSEFVELKKVVNDFFYFHNGDSPEK
ncbi:MAG TPA: NAD(P)/FAD-dependent oxidoreductase [Bacteroidales bacterium]|nr:NAD(P)/FAD-dependent oxidoreductase [Bacteroidales bacterium]HPT21387.1 NAD(P)/FAD-dependent oxidoreductase [Bacteroidales bacterium]